MELIPSTLSRQGFDKLIKKLRLLIGRVKRYHPQLTFNITEREVLDRIHAATLENNSYCEVTGYNFNDMGNVCLIPINPNIKGTVSINQILIVHQQTFNFWVELHKIIAETPDFMDINNSYAQLVLIHDTLRAKVRPERLSSKAIDHARLIERSLVTPERIVQLMHNQESTKDISAKQLPVFNASDFIRKPRFYSARAIQRKIDLCRERSISKGFTCDLTFENSKHLFSVTHCQLTGLPLVKATKTQEDNPFGFSIDRINRFEGYNVSNMLIVAHEVNKIKSKLEWSNYTESVDNLYDILTKTKDIMLKRHSHDNLHNRQKPLPIETIINNYLAKSENHKKFIFS